MKYPLLSLLLALLVVGCNDGARRVALEAEVSALRAERDALVEEVAALKTAAEPAAEPAPTAVGDSDEVNAGRRRALTEVFSKCESPCSKRFSAQMDEVLENWELMKTAVSRCATRCQGREVEPSYAAGEGDRGEAVTESERADLVRLFRDCEAPCAKNYVAHPEQIVDEDARRCLMMECD